MKNILYIGNALSDTGKTKTSIETLGVFLTEIYNIKTASNKSNKVLRIIDMVYLVLKNINKTDYVLVDTYSTSSFYFALIVSQICRFFRIKYIPILRGGDLENRLVKNPQLSDLIFLNAHKLIAPSQFLEYIFKNYGYNNILYIPNTLEIGNYSNSYRVIDNIKLLWVRSFSSIYNPEMAVFVLEKLLEIGHKVELTMIGPEVDGSMLKVKKIAEQKNVNINFTGKLAKSEWIELSKKSNLFINTTNVDNTPVSVIEAMALGLPVVSTNVGGLPYLITNEVDGLLVPPKDVNAMVRAIIRLKTDNELAYALTVNARSKVEKFDWEVVKPKWEALLS